MIQWSSLATFQMRFDLAFYALRYSETPITDLPRRGDGGFLRRCEDVSFLVAQVPMPTGASASAPRRLYLCEVHISFLLWGTNKSRWEAIMFADTYYDEKGESIIEYKYDPDDPEQMLVDPLRAGKAADPPILDPRRYFLDTMAVRVQGVEKESGHSLHVLSQTINESVSTCPFSWLSSIPFLFPVSWLLKSLCDDKLARSSCLLNLGPLL